MFCKTAVVIAHFLHVRQESGTVYHALCSAAQKVCGTAEIRNLPSAQCCAVELWICDKVICKNGVTVMKEIRSFWQMDNLSHSGFVDQ